MRIDFPGITIETTPQALVLRSDAPLWTLASAVVGGGFAQTRYIVNRHVDRSYNHADPEGDLRAFAGQHGITGPFVGLMTAVQLHRARTVTLHDGGLIVATVVTAGLSNPISAGLSLPAGPSPSTINLIVLIDANLTPAAMVNSIVTATEAKTHVLLARGGLTPDGHPTTGTSTDAIVVACTGRGQPLPYAGPATHVGWLLARCVRQALTEALECR